MGSCVSVEGGSHHCNQIRSSPAKQDGSEFPTSTKPKTITSKTVAIYLDNIQDLMARQWNNVLDIFTHEEMKLATGNFGSNRVLGRGGFGVVYKGIIDENVRPGYKATKVAIKVLDPESLQGEREWLAEVNYLGQLQHPNLVKLIGCCCEDDQRMLVYEYMSSASLEKHLFSKARDTLSWQRRLKIALDIAKGLAFLHGVEEPIIYRDFKSSNILLDEGFNAKLSDFGLARVGPIGDQTHVSTRVVGTYGYAAPEYMMTGHLTASSDVYGFGVVLLEMLLGRRAMDYKRPCHQWNLVEWARPSLKHSKKLTTLLDSRLQGQYTLGNLMKVAHLTYHCVSQTSKGRPVMSQVIEVLDSILAQEMTREEIPWPGGYGSVTIFDVADEAKRNRSLRKVEHDKAELAKARAL